VRGYSTARLGYCGAAEAIPRPALGSVDGRPIQLATKMDEIAPGPSRAARAQTGTRAVPETTTSRAPAPRYVAWCEHVLADLSRMPLHRWYRPRMHRRGVLDCAQRHVKRISGSVY
jgi:hypothetical protein